MYAALWRILPGPVWLRILLVIVLVAALLFALSTWVFPWIDALINPQNVTLDQ